MIENAIRSGRIEAGENTKRSAPRKKENEVNNKSTYNKGYSKAITVSQPKVITSGQQGSIRQESKNCTAFKKVVERLIKMRIVKFDETRSVENPLPNHRDKGVNVIGKSIVRRINEDIAKVKTPLRIVWREVVGRGLIVSDSVKVCEEVRDYCEFHKAEGHEIHECVEFRVLV
ncbi:hypothetical protein EPI10_027658 [Gossypium australe]|uniref:Uncharacterized protein n=1 Tax=Gossypium australe TaxID=47621 RepID=A0A5B6UX13_9ROSI|nr:hypothetical protein EPI10_027658 [Gossypium australe]